MQLEAKRKEEVIVLTDNTEARREDLITVVLEAFKSMGGTDKELAEERHRLDDDPEYVYEW
eukprot:4871579-Prymnesium_polylepis.1